MNKIINSISQFCTSLEKRFNLIVASLILGLIILGFDMLYVTPKFEAAYHGLQYSILSNNPFDFTHENALRYRILPSLIGYLTFLRGDLFFIVPLIFALLFISSVYWVYRRKNYSPVDAFLFTGMIAFSCTLYIQVAAPGYTDAVFYFFLFLSFAFVKEIVWSAFFYSLALLTHESSLFLLPGLILYSNYINGADRSKVLKHVVALIIAIVPLVLYRHWVTSHIHVEYGLDFYFSEQNISFTLKKVLPHLTAGLFYAFKLFWFFPVYILLKSWQKKDTKFFMLIAVIILCDIAQLIIAFDITRMLCLGFPAILLAAEKLKMEWDPQKFTRFVLALTLINFLVVQCFMSADALIPMPPLPYHLLLNYFGLNA